MAFLGNTKFRKRKKKNMGMNAILFVFQVFNSHFALQLLHWRIKDIINVTHITRYSCTFINDKTSDKPSIVQSWMQGKSVLRS